MTNVYRDRARLTPAFWHFSDFARCPLFDRYQERSGHPWIRLMSRMTAERTST